MSRAVSGLRGLLVRGDDALLAVRDRMTPGQRWTASLLMAIVCAVVLYGAPVSTVVVPSAASAAAGVRAPAPSSAGSAAVATVATPPFRTSVAIPAPMAADPVAPPAAAPAARVVAAPSTTSRPRVTALLPPPGPLPGRDERAAAEVFLAGAGFDVAATADVDADDACDLVGGDGTLVLVPEHVEQSLLECLRATGATALGFDALGTRPGVVSSRRGRTQSLLSLARWAASGGDLGRRSVGVVGGAEDRSWVEGVLPRLRAAGLRVTATAFPADEPGAVTAGVRELAGSGVEVVVFAAPAAIRREWSAQHALLAPAVRFLVADVHEGVTEERHAPTFDGALAVTTLRGSWYARTHGETPEQAVCRTAWEAAARRMLGADEGRWVHSWCQHVAAADAAVREALSAGDAAGSALARLRVPSPVTSDLGPGSEGWGPRAEAVVVWRSSCACWTEVEPFG